MTEKFGALGGGNWESLAVVMTRYPMREAGTDSKPPNDGVRVLTCVSLRVFCVLSRINVIVVWMTEAVGTASMSPRTPAANWPARRAKMMMTGCRFADEPTILGVKKFVSMK